MKTINSETDPENIPHKFSVGDQVTLRSGSPVMTVSKLCHTMDHLAYVDCMWFPHTDSPLPSTQRFPQDALEVRLTPEAIKSPPSEAVQDLRGLGVIQGTQEEV
jgi:uncharacterized protein YodC (DUF2158 family)